MFKLLVFIFMMCLPLALFSQKDSSKVEPYYGPDTSHSPKKAAILSAVLPGTGQFYNKKYWKMPIVYLAMGTSIYFIIDNTKNYKSVRQEYLYRINNNGSTSNSEFDLFSDGQLRTLTDQYRRWRDLSYVALAACYALQIVDATVDAYLYRFDDGESLSFHFRPTWLSTTSISPGFKLSLKF